MSRDHAKKEMVTGEKPATSHGKAPSGESGNKVKGSPSHDKSRRSGDKKKKMKKVVYYETDSSSPSTVIPKIVNQIKGGSYSYIIFLPYDIICERPYLSEYLK
jgi:hypothetical protein